LFKDKVYICGLRLPFKAKVCAIFRYTFKASLKAKVSVYGKYRKI